MSGNAAPTFTGEAAGGIPSRGERPVPPRRDGRSDGRHRHSPRHRPRTPNRPGPPRFTSAATLTVSEYSTAADTVTAVDDDTGETVTGYAITGDADRSRFSINSGGRLSFNTAPDYEHPADTDQDNTYQIIVTATSGTGTRATTATQARSASPSPKHCQRARLLK